MQIVLMGYMASGKSAVGKKLAAVLNCDFVDLDTYIETEEQATIGEIFGKKGEIYFRKKETEYLQALLKKNSVFVLALGGGTPCYGTNLTSLLESDCHLVYLKASIAVIVARLLKEKHKRPLVSHLNDEEALQEFVGKHLFERSAYYNKANRIVEVDNLSVDEIVEQVILPLF